MALGESSLQKPGESMWRAFDRYILSERARREALSAELKWHEDRMDVYDEKAQERFKAMREILDRKDTE
jgi:hypothetical protein